MCFVLVRSLDVSIYIYIYKGKGCLSFPNLSTFLAHLLKFLCWGCNSCDNLSSLFAVCRVSGLKFSFKMSQNDAEVQKQVNIDLVSL